MHKKKKLVEKVRHRINVLHLYCWLCRITRDKKKAMRLARLWEITPIYRVIYLRAEKDRRKGDKRP